MSWIIGSLHVNVNWLVVSAIEEEGRLRQIGGSHTGLATSTDFRHQGEMFTQANTTLTYKDTDPGH